MTVYFTYFFELFLAENPVFPHLAQTTLSGKIE